MRIAGSSWAGALLFACLLVALPGFLADAEDRSHTPHHAAGDPAIATKASAETPFLDENAAAMAKMMDGMAVEPTGDVDRDFVAMMVPHHQGAIDMAIALLRHGHNEQLKRLAQEIIVTQQQEIAAMRLAIGERPPLPAAAPTQPSPAPAPPFETRN